VAVAVAVGVTGTGIAGGTKPLRSSHLCDISCMAAYISS
jgi:hypothetical protein